MNNFLISAGRGIFLILNFHAPACLLRHGRKNNFVGFWNGFVRFLREAHSHSTPLANKVLNKEKIRDIRVIRIKSTN